MATEEWFPIKTRFKSEWGECLVQWVSWNAFLLLSASFEGVCFVAGRRWWKLGAIKGVLSCLCLSALAALGAGSPPSALRDGSTMPGVQSGPWLGWLGFSFGGSPAVWGRAGACWASMLPEEWQEAASHQLHRLPINLMGSLYRQDSGVLG